MTNVAVVQQMPTGVIVGVFHSETKSQVLSIAKSSLTMTYQRVGELLQVEGNGAIDSGVWITPTGHRMTIRHHVSYGQVEHM